MVFKLNRGLVALLAASMLAGCAPRVAHKALPDDQVGLAALRPDAVREVVLGPDIQKYVGQYPLFAEVINQEILHDLDHYVDQYNVHARERLTFTETSFSELDPFLLRAAKVNATVRVATRLLNYVGLRLKTYDSSEVIQKDRQEIYFTMTPEELSLAVQRVRERKGTLTGDQKRDLARDVVALAADLAVVDDAVKQAKGLLAEGENLKAMLDSPAFTQELKARDGDRAKLLPEARSNLNGTLAGLRAASEDGPSIVKNGRMWMLILADAMQ